MEQAVKNFINFTDFTFIPSERMNIHIFKVKPTDEAMMKLIETGLFDGTEKFIRKTTIKRGQNEYPDHIDWRSRIYTIIHNDGHSYSWEYSSSEYPCISEKTRMEEKIINSAIETLLN